MKVEINIETKSIVIYNATAEELQNLIEQYPKFTFRSKIEHPYTQPIGDSCPPKYTITSG